MDVPKNGGGGLEMRGLRLFLALSLNLVILYSLGQLKNVAKLIKLFDKKIFFEMRCEQEIHLKCGDTRQLSKMGGGICMFLLPKILYA